MVIEGKVAIVTGASSGIGQSTALALAERGAKVALGARRADRLEALASRVAKAGGKATVVPTDVTDRGQVRHLVEQTRSSFGSVDILINNAGLMPLSLMKNLHEDEWERMVDVNLKGALFCIGAVLPHMMEQGGGHIINVSSVAGRRVFPGGAVYCGTKHALTAISEGLRSELSPKKRIRVTCIEPGAVATELTDSITDPVMKQGSEAMQQMKQLEGDDIARAIVYALEQPDHVDVGELLLMPTDQR
ncbi:MAG: SDR family oxidoreductase [Myxococcota bacterium]